MMSMLEYELILSPLALKLAQCVVQRDVSSVIQVVTTSAELEEIKRYRFQTYRERYPRLDMLQEDVFDATSLVLYSRDYDGAINATVRLAFDSVHGIPSEALIQPNINQYREQNLRVAEFGRFVINDRGRGLSTLFYIALYQLAKAIGLDVIVFVMREKQLEKHLDLCNVEVINRNVQESFGSEHQFVGVAWHIKQTPDRFFEWTHIKR